MVSEAAMHLAAKVSVELPIIQTAHSVLFGGVPATRATAELMDRGAKGEVW